MSSPCRVSGSKSSGIVKNEQSSKKIANARSRRYAFSDTGFKHAMLVSRILAQNKKHKSKEDGFSAVRLDSRITVDATLDTRKLFRRLGS